MTFITEFLAQPMKTPFIRVEEEDFWPVVHHLVGVQEVMTVFVPHSSCFAFK